jgi:ribose-phosphate pyrophosphokinase
VFKKVCILQGNAHPELGEAIAAFLETPLGKSKITRFSDGESFCEIGENVRGVDAFVIQPTCSPVNDTVMELLIMCDALRRASAASITAVIPYYGYARQDRKVAPRTPITSKLVADLLVAAGVMRVVSMDLHAGQIQGFFNIPFDHLFAMPVILEELRKSHDSTAVFVSPDAGGVERARAFSKRMNASLAIIDKRRERANVAEVMNLIGDVRGRDCIIVDDMIDTAGTVSEAARALRELGAKDIFICATHALLSGPAAQRLTDSPVKEVAVTDTIATPTHRRFEKLVVLSVGELISKAIRFTHSEQSVSSLFD